MRVTQHRMRNAVGDQLPGLAVIRRLVNPRVAVVDLMAIDGDVRCARVVAGRFDIADCAPRQHVGDILRQVRPRLTAVASDLHLAIVCARPNCSGFFR